MEISSQPSQVRGLDNILNKKTTTDYTVFDSTITIDDNVYEGFTVLRMEYDNQ